MTFDIRKAVFRLAIPEATIAMFSSRLLRRLALPPTLAAASLLLAGCARYLFVAGQSAPIAPVHKKSGGIRE